MKADEDVRMISAEAPILFAKACELFILELTIRSWLHAEENKRRTLQKNDIAAAITRTDIFDFLVDIVPRDEIKDETGLAPMVGATASGVPYFYPPMGQPAGGGPGGMMIGRPAVDPTGGIYGQPPSQAWQSVWQTAGTDDGSYGSGVTGGQGNLDGQGIRNILLEYDGNEYKYHGANLKSWVRYRTVDGVENARNSGDLLGNLCFCAY
ncbi:nuclear transcription factor Y subunit C-9-like [Gossypium australe]|uniref:Nuclear transcription factor Y subunit C-9-like n=1 Tax=Gossypium australe TaxID=47621 RepID=A0A5B6UT82_9ROSI|nr:nuclear transcription factor Y subunit C-9-like [Gossypium australe]